MNPSSADAGDQVFVVNRQKIFTDLLAEGTVSSAPVHPWVGVRFITALTYGASGSPVCNSRGEVVAIIRAGDHKDNQTGFAIPAVRLSALAAKNPYPLSQMATSEPLDTSILATSAAKQ